jgi:hypothetical protein
MRKRICVRSTRPTALDDLMIGTIVARNHEGVLQFGTVSTIAYLRRDMRGQDRRPCCYRLRPFKQILANPLRSLRIRTASIPCNPMGENAGAQRVSLDPFRILSGDCGQIMIKGIDMWSYMLDTFLLFL